MDILSLRQAARVARVAPSTLLAHLDNGTGPRAEFTEGPSGRRNWMLTEADVRAWVRARITPFPDRRRRGRSA